MQEGVTKMFGNLDAKMVCAALDNAKISTEGWREIFSQLKVAASDAELALKVKSTSNPNQVKAAKVELDGMAKDSILKDVDPRSDDIELELDAMIKLAVGCSISSGVLRRRTLVEDGHVKVVITLDETTWASAKKLERVCLKVVNQMVKTPTETLIQSELDVYPLMMFYVDKEDHKVLSEKLKHVNERVVRFNAGETLDFPDIGALGVEMHLAADLKTLHAVYGVSNSPTAHLQNLYDVERYANRARVMADVIRSGLSADAA